MIRLLIICFLTGFSGSLYAQQDSTGSKISFHGDFRFRIEQDWNSRKSNGELRTDRSRLRYRVRLGMNYQYNNWASIGARLRTGDPKKQQDPQLTLGDGFKEFGTLPFALEKAYFKAQGDKFLFWVGKNTFPFQKQNELFWSDNVYPEGIFLQRFLTKNIHVQGGHFLINTRNSSFAHDSFFHAWQASSSFADGKIQLFPAMYLFRNIQNIPDGGETFLMDYTVFHLGGNILNIASTKFDIELDYYYNLENYERNDSIPATLQNQKTGWVVALGYGKLRDRGDWEFKLTYCYLERFAAVDFLAQNDWARWDYSSSDSPDGRLTNLSGIELVAGYCIDKNLVLKVKYYKVEQIIPYGIARETGSRIRLDLDIGF